MISVILLAFVIASAAGDTTTEKVTTESLYKPLEWWQQAVVHQIYPRSFQDSDGDGIGDLKGITSKLDYFVDLGVDTVWISPIYESPMKDFGYDISNFTNIEPTFGTLADFAEMVKEFHKRDLKLIMDMVPNHSSDLHEWFVKSVEREDPYTDYYVWRDANGMDKNGAPLPPNNWVSVFGGSAWEWREERKQFYLHQFVKEQPDLNFENIEVRNEMLAVIKFWLDQGVDGFRVDAVPHMYEDQDLRDEPENPKRDPKARSDEYRYWNHPYTYDLPKVLDYLADMRQLLDVYSKADGRVRCMMVESTVPDDSIMNYYGTKDKPVSHFPFNFHLLHVKPEMNATEVLNLVNIWYDLLPEGHWATFLLGNHDNLRAPTRWTAAGVDGANMINLLLQGTSISYYGEEIGMSDTSLTWKETVDPAGCNTDPERYQIFSRDPSRTPMQWTGNEPAGDFSSSSKTWLPLNKNFKELNVDKQNSVEESHLKVYKGLVKLRQTDAWRYGSYDSKALQDDKVLGFTRIPPVHMGNTTGSLLVLVNLSNDTVTVDGTFFQQVPTTGKLVLRSVNFASNVAVGSEVDLHRLELGPRNSAVFEFVSLDLDLDMI